MLKGVAILVFPFLFFNLIFVFTILHQFNLVALYKAGRKPILVKKYQLTCKRKKTKKPYINSSVTVES
jgi:hypothetical protein